MIVFSWLRRSLGIDLDKSYNLERKKSIPDLVVEVILSSSGINILQLYQGIGVPEVWLWEDRILEVYHLQVQLTNMETRNHD